MEFSWFELVAYYAQSKLESENFSFPFFEEMDGAIDFYDFDKTYIRKTFNKNQKIWFLVYNNPIPCTEKQFLLPYNCFILNLIMELTQTRGYIHSIRFFDSPTPTSCRI